MGGGGKGGSKSETTTIPEWIKAPALRNIGRAEEAQQIGYMPYYGPEVAAFNPTQQAAFNANIGAAEAFGLLAPGSLEAMQGMAPEPQTFAGGVQGYSSGPLFDQALAELEARRPGQVAAYNRLFVDPQSGAESALAQEQAKQQIGSYSPAGTIAPLRGSPARYNSRFGTWEGLPYGWERLAEGSNYVVKADIGPAPTANSNYAYTQENGWQLIS